jgi:uncharacterized protein (TIGR03790 family)
MPVILAQVTEFLYGEIAGCHPGADRRLRGASFPLFFGLSRAMLLLVLSGLTVLPAAAQYSAAASDPGAFLNHRYDFGQTPRVERGIRVPRIQGHITRSELGLVINTADPYSVEVGEFYIRARGLTSAQVLRLQLPVRASLTVDEFRTFAAAVDSFFGAPIEALALAWTFPYAVNCNAITGALALGYDGSLCEHSCAASARSPYFNSASAHPHAELKMRPAMLLAARDVAMAKAMIRRGVASDGTLGLRGATPVNAYFVTTQDKARSARAPLFPPAGLLRPAGVEVHLPTGDSIGNAEHVLIYETGLPVVPGLDTVHWVPGALADHLTSFGGMLDGSSGQMTVLDWIASGATATYGTVSEPCAHPQKFPHPQVLLLNYVQGASAIEAYWKSVAWPQQGLFVGEPLAAPFAHR